MKCLDPSDEEVNRNVPFIFRSRPECSGVSKPKDRSLQVIEVLYGKEPCVYSDMSRPSTYVANVLNLVYK